MQRKLRGTAQRLPVKDPEHVILARRQADGPIAVAVCITFDWQHNGFHAAHIGLVARSLVERGTGCGDEALDAAIDYIEQTAQTVEGSRGVLISGVVHPRNVESNAMMSRNGFTLLGTNDDEYNEYQAQRLFGADG